MKKKNISEEENLSEKQKKIKIINESLQELKEILEKRNRKEDENLSKEEEKRKNITDRF